MIYVFLLLIIAMLSFTWIIERNVYSPIFILLTIWIVIFVLCGVNEYNYNISDKVYLVVMLGLVASFVGFVVSKNSYKQKKRTQFDFEVTISGRLFYVVFFTQIIGLIVLLSFAFVVKDLVASGVDYYQIRYQYLDRVLENRLTGLMYSYVIRPGLVFLMPLTTYNFFINTKNKLYIAMFVTEILSVLLVVYNLGERYIFMDFVICLITVFLIVKNKVKLKNKISKKLLKRTKRLVLTGLVAFLIVFIVISNGRGSDINETLYTYLSGCMPHMSQKIESFDSAKSYTYGMTSFQGVFRPIYKVIEVINGQDISSGLFYVAELHKEMIETPGIIGDGILFNGFISMFFYFYIDMGMIGVVIISFVMSLIISRAYMKLKYNGNSYSLICYCLLVSVYSSSFFQFQFSSLNLAMALLMYYLYCMLGKRRIRISTRVNGSASILQRK